MKPYEVCYIFLIFFAYVATREDCQKDFFDAVTFAFTDSIPFVSLFFVALPQVSQCQMVEIVLLQLFASIRGATTPLSLLMH